MFNTSATKQALERDVLRSPGGKRMLDCDCMIAQTPLLKTWSPLLSWHHIP